MKRSYINTIMQDALGFMDEYSWKLPECRPPGGQMTGKNTTKSVSRSLNTIWAGTCTDFGGGDFLKRDFSSLLCEMEFMGKARNPMQKKS